MSSLSDISHVDPCRHCGGQEVRANMVPARLILGPGSRGYLCKPCVNSPGVKAKVRGRLRP